MYLKAVISAIAVCLLAVVQIGFVSGLPGWLRHADFVILVMVFILGMEGMTKALVYSAVIGFLLDIYSFGFFGLNSLALFATALAANFLLANLFTNRSLYSFAALTAVSVILFKMFLAIGARLYMFASGAGSGFDFNLAFWQDRLIEGGINMAISVAVFYMMANLGNSFKPAFLNRKIYK